MRHNEERMRRVLEIPPGRRRAEFLAAVAMSRNLRRFWASPPKNAKAFDENLKRDNSPAHAGYGVLSETAE
jgi:hypothetical protein